MKKVLAVVLALVMALSMSTIAFADDTSADLGSVSDAFSSIVNATGVDTGTSVFDTISESAAEAFQALTTIDFSVVEEDDGIVAGIIEGFRDTLENLGISTIAGKIAELFSNLKQKIKDLFTADDDTVAAVSTSVEEEVVPATGSSASAAVAAFAAFSAAAAAAYVCTKKKVA